MELRVDILMAAYNCESYIEEAIKSILNQSYQNFNLIICNDASTDSTLKTIKKFNDPRIKVLDNSNNLGYLKTFNKLLSYSTSELITFLDSDDYCTPDRIYKQVSRLEENKKLGLVGCNFAAVDSGGNVNNISNFPNNHKDIIKDLQNNTEVCFCGSSVMIRRKVVEDIGGYREFFIGCPGEDYDWIRRISEKFHVENIPDVCYYYRFHPGSLTRKVHFSIKVRHINEIIKFLANQRVNKGIDDLMTEDQQELNLFIESLEAPYRKDKSMLDRKVSFEYALQRNWKMSFQHFFKAITNRPTIFHNYLLGILLLPLLILPERLLLKGKKILKLNHVSRNL